MPRAIKLFSGTASSTVTVYTVPVGRVAKVTLLNLDKNGISGFTPFIANSGASFGLKFPTLGQHVTVNDEVATALATNSPAEEVMIHRIWYLAAGETVGVSGPNSVTYRILVIEEY